MIPASNMVAFLKAFAHFHHIAGVPIHPTHASTMCELLNSCELQVIALEQAKSRPAASVTAAATGTDENVIHLHFNRQTPPEGGAA